MRLFIGFSFTFPNFDQLWSKIFIFKILVKENGKMFCSETALEGTKHFPKDIFSCSFSQGHPTTVFCKISVGGSKNRLEFSITFYSLRKAKNF